VFSAFYFRVGENLSTKLHFISYQPSYCLCDDLESTLNIEAEDSSETSPLFYVPLQPRR